MIEGIGGIFCITDDILVCGTTQKGHETSLKCCWKGASNKKLNCVKIIKVAALRLVRIAWQSSNTRKCAGCLGKNESDNSDVNTHECSSGAETERYSQLFQSVSTQTHKCNQFVAKLNASESRMVMRIRAKHSKEYVFSPRIPHKYAHLIIQICR